MINKYVIPTVFSSSYDDFLARFKRVKAISSSIQIDFMDGIFVSSQSPKIKDIFDLKEFPQIVFEAHLMYANPKKFVQDCIDKGFKKIIFHYESQESPHEVHYMWLYIKKNGLIPVLALNPNTSADVLKDLPFVDFVLCMGVNPGKEKQVFIEDVYTKIARIKKMYPHVLVQVDGGITESVAKELAQVGCDFINTGSFVSESSNPLESLLKLETSFKEGLDKRGDLS